jgi:hypothetical protein
MRVEDEDDPLLGYLLELSDVCSSDLSTPDALWDVLGGKGVFVDQPHERPPLLETTLECSSLQESSTDFSSSRWFELLGKVSDTVRRDCASAFDIHLAASQALVLGCDHTSSTVSVPSNERFVTLCILLCCWALQMHSRQLSSIQKRPKRWQSLVWETLNLFRLHLQGVDVLGDHLMSVWIPLWTKYVLPCSYELQFSLFSASDPSASKNLVLSLRRSDTAYVAVVVAVTTRLARMCLHTYNEVAPLEIIKQNVRTLLQCMWDPLDGCYEDILWSHPWRQFLYQPGGASDGRGECFKSLQSALFYWSVIRNHDEATDIEDETMSMVDTKCEPLGLAALAAVAWSQRPCVLSPTYCWRLWFPHVSVLVNDESGPDDTIDTTEEDRRCDRLCSRLLGYDLLRRLLYLVRPYSLAQAVTRGAPDDPIGVLQLLANRIVAASAEVDRIANRVCQWPQQDSAQLPTEGVAFQIMKDVVARYQPSVQITIVRDLVRDCPHPGLQPKLVDLLQPFVTWNDSCAIKRVCDFCDEALVSLEKSLEPGMYGGGSNVHVFDELVEASEFYTACLGLLYRWMRVAKSLPQVPQLFPRISTVRSGLRDTLQRQAASKVHQPGPSFRLHLLESMLELMMAQDRI